MVLLRGIGIAKKGLGKVLGRDKTEAIKSFKPGTRFKGQKTVDKVQSDAAKAKLDSVKFNLDQTFKGSDKALNKLKKTIKTLKRN